MRWHFFKLNCFYFRLFKILFFRHAHLKQVVTSQAQGGCYSLIQDAHTKLPYLSFSLVRFVNSSFQRSPVAMRTPSSISRVPRGLLAVVFSAAVLRARFAAQGSSCWSHFSSLGDKNQNSVITVISLNVTWRILWRKTTEYVKVSLLHLVIQCSSFFLNKFPRGYELSYSVLFNST